MLEEFQGKVVAVTTATKRSGGQRAKTVLTYEEYGIQFQLSIAARFDKVAVVQDDLAKSIKKKSTGKPR